MWLKRGPRGGELIVRVLPTSQLQGPQATFLDNSMRYGRYGKYQLLYLQSSHTPIIPPEAKKSILFFRSLLLLLLVLLLPPRVNSVFYVVMPPSFFSKPPVPGKVNNILHKRLTTWVYDRRRPPTFSPDRVLVLGKRRFSPGTVLREGWYDVEWFSIESSFW